MSMNLFSVHGVTQTSSQRHCCYSAHKEAKPDPGNQTSLATLVELPSDSERGEVEGGGYRRQVRETQVRLAIE